MEQVKDIMPNIALACVMGVIVYPLKYLESNSLIILLIQIVAGGIVYVVGSVIFGLESFKYLLEIATSYIKKRRM